MIPKSRGMGNPSWGKFYVWDFYFQRKDQGAGNKKKTKRQNGDNKISYVYTSGKTCKIDTDKNGDDHSHRRILKTFHAQKIYTMLTFGDTQGYEISVAPIQTHRKTQTGAEDSDDYVRGGIYESKK